MIYQHLPQIIQDYSNIEIKQGFMQINHQHFRFAVYQRYLVSARLALTSASGVWTGTDCGYYIQIKSRERGPVLSYIR